MMLNGKGLLAAADKLRQETGLSEEQATWIAGQVVSAYFGSDRPIKASDPEHDSHESDHIGLYVERIDKISREGLRLSFEDEDAPDDLRLDNFVIAAVFAWTDEDGSEKEGTAVWSEARRHYVKLGMLENAVDAVKELL